MSRILIALSVLALAASVSSGCKKSKRTKNKPGQVQPAADKGAVARWRRVLTTNMQEGEW